MKKIVLAGLMVVSMASTAMASEADAKAGKSAAPGITADSSTALASRSSFASDAYDLERLKKMGVVKVECTSMDTFQQPAWVKMLTFGLASETFQEENKQSFRWKGGLDAVRLIVERNKDFDLIAGRIVSQFLAPDLLESKVSCKAEGQKPLFAHYDSKEGRYAFVE